MKYRLLIAGVLAAMTLSAQSGAPPPVTGLVVIKGHVKNSTKHSWLYGLANYLDGRPDSALINANGDFEKKIGVGEFPQDLYLYLNDEGIPMYVQKGDTIEVNWDANDFDKTFSIRSPAITRDHELQVALSLYKLYGKEELDLERYEYKFLLPDSARFSMINRLYNKEIEALLRDGVYPGTPKMATDIYFKFSGYLLEHHFFPAYDLFVQSPSEKSRSIPLLNAKKFYLTESEADFRSSSNYRHFIFNYYRLTFDDSANMNGSWHDYKAGLAHFKIHELRDWFITRSIMLNFESLPFDKISEVYNDYKTKDILPYYADTLKKFYAKMQRVRPGGPAPGFTLTDENGGSVSLNDLRGKCIFMDFWGVGCDPCISEIKNSIPGLHEKYKDKNIVFVNICVAGDTAEWKKSIAELHLKGINLIAEGWADNPVCKAYNIAGIPHYFIIDAAGNIVDNNAPRPWLDSLYTELDKLLNQ
jgi:peroxiredoxin